MSGFAFTEGEQAESFVASGDLSGCFRRVVDLLASDLKIGIAPANGGYGVLLNAPKDGEHASVCVGGRTMVFVGAAVAPGDDLTSAASGWAVKVATGTSARILGRALTTAASGMLATVDVKQYYHADSVGI